MSQYQNTSSRFKLNCTKEEAITILRASFKAVVQMRGNKPEITPEIEKIIVEIASIMTSEHRKFGLMLSGQCGNGKSTMAKAVSNTIRILSLAKRYDNPNLNVLTISAKEIARMSKEETKRISNRILLSIDDFGNEPAEIQAYGNIWNPLVDLLEYRYDYQLFTIITTNLTPPQISEKYGMRITDRFREMLNIIVFKGKSFRK